MVLKKKNIKLYLKNTKDNLTLKNNKSNIGFYKKAFALVLLMPLGIILFAKGAVIDTIPKKWIEQWQNPPADLRPLQIVHTMDLRNPEEMNLKGARNPVKYLRDSCGLGGVVCNVMGGKNYLQSDEDWKRFVEGVRYLRENNLRVWIYDEDGYPSLSAGGLVLEGHPELESLEMVYDKGSIPQFYSRPSYEFTHASNNWSAARRYPNPLDRRATERFIDVTQKAYLDHLGRKLFAEVEAFFTDEASLMAVDLGQIPENARIRIRVQDPLDISKKELPAIPWVNDLPAKYKQKYNEDLMPLLLSLFEGNSQIDKEIRQKFWSLIGEVDNAYYYGAIQNWCKKVRTENQNKGPVLSGHGLREECVLIHVPLEGNKMQALTGLDIPGLDMLDSDPKAWMKSNEPFSGDWQAAVLPNSVAQLTGKRIVMCEISDFTQKQSGKEPVRLEEMQSASAWQMAWGVTEFNLYYTISYGAIYPFRNESTHKAYCDFVGRINAIVRDAKPIRTTLLYYPIYDMQREYNPTSTPVSIKTQNEKVQQIENSFNQLGLSLAKAQIPFILVDYLFLESAKITNRGTILIGENEYNTLVLPQGVLLPPKVELLVNEIKAKGIKVLSVDQNTQTPTSDELILKINPIEKVIPARNEIAFGKFTRSGRDIYLLVNSGTEVYKGNLTVMKKGIWSIMDPQTGKISSISTTLFNGKNILPISLESNQTFIYISK
jgi:hypothetical protein